ncbi:MAG: (2Fe-2S)-binding protein [Planctomycetota bacterium]|nr:(2Fe-2S)-binding protein [Planctomycetota bacterium]
MSDAKPFTPGHTPPPPMQDLVCYCFQVTEREVEAAIRLLGLKTIEDVNDATRAGCGCHTCWPDLESILNRCLRGQYKFDLTDEDRRRFAARHGTPRPVRPGQPE